MDLNDLNLNQLRIFHTVARLLSFTGASRELHLTQPGISMHIKELEKHYKTRLFDRLGKKIVLTQAGTILFKATENILGLVNDAKIKIDDLQGLTSGTLNIGASTTIGTYILPELLVKFRHAHPNIEIAMDISLSQEVVEKVLNNTIEIGFVGHCTREKKLLVKPFAKDPMVLIVAAKHPWAGRRQPVRLQDLSDQPILLARRGSGTRAIMERLFARQKISPKNCMELGTVEGVKKAVEIDLGISIISKYVVARELAAGLIKTVAMSGVDLNRDLYLLYHKDRYLSGAARAFLALLP